MSLSAQYATWRSIGPFGYNSGRTNGHYQAVLPTSKSSMHLNLHRNVPDRIRPRSVLDNSRGILAGLKLLDKQKPKMKRFIGVDFEMTRKEQEELSSRLAQFNPYRFPAESKGSLPPIDQVELGNCFRTYTEDEVKRLVCQVTYKQSLSAEEVQTIVDRLAIVKPANKKNSARPSKEKKFASADVDALVERLAKYDPESWPAESRGKPARDRDMSDLLKGSKKSTAGEVKQIVDRLATYDPKKWPPGSRHVDEDLDEETRGKKASGDEVDQIVSRLTNYDKKRWPPESQGMKNEFYQGRPLKFKNQSE